MQGNQNRVQPTAAQGRGVVYNVIRAKIPGFRTEGIDIATSRTMQILFDNREAIKRLGQGGLPSFTHEFPTIVRDIKDNYPEEYSVLVDRRGRCCSVLPVEFQKAEIYNALCDLAKDVKKQLKRLENNLSGIYYPERNTALSRLSRWIPTAQGMGLM